MIALGIDIGLSGAIASVRGDQLLGLEDMPTRVKPGASLVRREIDGRALYELILRMCGERSDEAIAVCLENVYGMRNPKKGGAQGAASVFSFGDTRGAIRTAVEILRLKPMWVSPVSWKRSYGLIVEKGDKPPEKSKSILKAASLYPMADLSMAKHQNRAEALLIARFGWDSCA